MDPEINSPIENELVGTRLYFKAILNIDLKDSFITRGFCSSLMWNLMSSDDIFIHLIFLNL